jgi:hypothetical protein
MGLVRMGPPFELIKALVSSFGIKNFVETGTYLGQTAIEAQQYFSKVFTIEYSKEVYEKTKINLEKYDNIQSIWGDSRVELNQLIPQLNEPSLFWLDAHWSGGNTYGKNDECPLIEELKIIQTLTIDTFVFVDDIRLFTSPPPLPHKAEQWPTFVNIIDELRKHNTDTYIVLIEDVLIAVPSFARSMVEHYCQQVNTETWKRQGQLNFFQKINTTYGTLSNKIKARLK